MVPFAELALRFVVGGAVVSAFSVAGELFEPKTFAGIFGAAPSVALASLGLAFAQSGPAYVATSARAMLAGAIGFFAFTAACIVLIRRGVRTWVGALVSLGVWLVTSFGAHALQGWL